MLEVLEDLRDELDELDEYRREDLIATGYMQVYANDGDIVDVGDAEDEGEHVTETERTEEMRLLAEA